MQMLSHLILPQNYEFSSQFFTWKTLWNCRNKVKDLWWIFCRSGFLFEDMLGRHQRKSSIEPFKFLLVLKYSSVYSFRFFKKEVALHIHHLKSGYSCNIRKWPYPEPFPRIIRVWRKKQYISYSSFSFEKNVCLWDTKKEQNKSISSLQPIWQNFFLPDSWINTHFLLSLPFLFRASYSPVPSAAPWFWPIILVLYAASRLEVAFSLPHVPGWTFVVAKMCYFRRMKQRDQMQFHYYSPGRFHLSQMGNGREIYLENGSYVFQGFCFFCKKKNT